jgi:hypothetical protein
MAKKIKRNIGALTQLKRIIAGIPPDMLDLRTYGTTKHCKDDIADLATWAARDEWFISRGFKMQDIAGHKGVHTYPDFNGNFANHATKTFFGLTDEENDYLFGSYEDSPHPLAAVLLDRVDRLMANTIPVVEVESEGGNAA